MQQAPEGAGLIKRMMLESVEQFSDKIARKKMEADPGRIGPGPHDLKVNKA
jgi:hypothetical protein